MNSIWMQREENVNPLEDTKKCIALDISSENVKGRKYFGDLGVNWRVILI